MEFAEKTNNYLSQRQLTEKLVWMCRVKEVKSGLTFEGNSCTFLGG